MNMNAKNLAQLFANYFNITVKYYFAINRRNEHKSIAIEAMGYNTYDVIFVYKESVSKNIAGTAFDFCEFQPNGEKCNEYDMAKVALKVCIEDKQEVFWYCEESKTSLLPKWPVAHFGKKNKVLQPKIPNGFNESDISSFHTHPGSPLPSSGDIIVSDGTYLWQKIIGRGNRLFIYRLRRRIDMDELEGFNNLGVQESIDELKKLYIEHKFMLIK